MAFNAKRNDPKLFTAGAWVSMMGADFKLARAGNPAYEQALEDSGYRNLEDPQDKQRALYSSIAAGIVRDWDEVVDNDGKHIPFNTENATEVLLDNPDLVNRVLTEANTLENYRREDVGTQAKKAATGSDSSKNGASQAKA